MDSGLLQKIKTLPQEVLYLLTAEKAVDLSVVLSERYHFNQEQLGAYSDLIAKLYLKELRLSDLYTQVKHIFNFDESTTKALCCDIVGFKLLVVSDWLGEDAANYLRTLGGDIADYSFEIQELRRLAQAEMDLDAKESAEPDLPPMDEADESAISDTEEDLAEDDTVVLSDTELTAQFIGILSEQLTELLSTDDNLFIYEFNNRLIELLGTKPEVKNELINALLKNTSRLSGESIVLDGRQVDPSIGNWIRYFITQKGSSQIDSVVLSDFLVNSPNARFLNDREKILLSRLIQLYNNIKFFPDSLVGDNPENWVIMPLSNEANHKFITLSDTSQATPKTATANVSQPNQASRETAKIDSLQQLAQKYPAGSLERLAIEEELKRLRAN